MLNYLFLATFFALGSSCIYLWLRTARNLEAGIPLIEKRGFEFPFGFLDVLVMFIFWCLGQGMALVIAKFVFQINLDNLAEISGDALSMLTFALGLGQLVATLAAMTFLYARYRSFSIFGWQSKKLKRDLVVGLLGFLMVVPLVLLIQALLTQYIAYEHSTQQMLLNNANFLTVFASWFSAVLVAPICEEVFFRGILQGYLQRLIPSSKADSDQKLLGGWPSLDTEMEEGSGQLMPTVDIEAVRPQRSAFSNTDPRPTVTPIGHYWPIIASALIFALAHAGQGPAPIPLFFFGIALGFVFYRTGSIISCIVIHMLLNAFSMFWFTLSVLFPTPEDATEATEVISSVEFHSVSDYLLCLLSIFN